MAVLAYFGVLIIIPFIFAKDIPFVKFHIKQGLVLISIGIIVWIIGMLFPGLWQLLQIINLGTLILAIVGIVNALNYKEIELPLTGSFSEYFKI